MTFVDVLAEKVISMSAGSARPFFVSVCGWADTGKSTLAGLLCSAIQRRKINADSISTDAFLNDRESRNKLCLTGYNPASIDADELVAAVKKLSEGESYVYFPYENRSGKKVNQSKLIATQPVIIIEGIHALHSSLLPYLDYRIFIDSGTDVLRVMRINANMTKRDMNSNDACRRVDFEFEEFRKYISPTKEHADCLVNVSMEYDYTFV